jgi:two-component system, NarL family, response regulator DevR
MAGALCQESAMAFESVRETQDTRPAGETAEHEQLTRIYVLGDGDIARYGIRSRLQTMERVEVVGDGRSGPDLVERVRSVRPSVLVVQAKLADRDAILAARRVRAADSVLRVLLITSADEREAILVAVVAGAVGYVHRAGGDHELADGLGRAIGLRNRDTAPLRRLRDGLLHDSRRPRLDAADIELVGYLIRDLTDPQIGCCLGVDETAVSRRVAAVLAKLHARHTAPW